MIISGVNKLKQYIDMLCSAKIKHTLHKNTYSTLVDSKLGKRLFTNSYVPIEELYFIKQVNDDIKKKVHKEIKLAKGLSYDDVDFIGFNSKVKNKIFKNVVEIDINYAYWESANKLGLLSKNIYERGKGMNKKTRLVSLGRLAKVTDIYYFDGKKTEFIKTENSNTKKLWVGICTGIDDLMGEIKKDCGGDFIFYWVDAIFVKEPAVNKVKQILSKYGYSYKTNKIDKIECKRSKVIVYIEGEYPREFFYKSEAPLFEDV